MKEIRESWETKEKALKDTEEKKKQAEQIAHFMQERRGGLKSKSVDISAVTDISAAAREDGARWVAATRHPIH